MKWLTCNLIFFFISTSNEFHGLYYYHHRIFSVFVPFFLFFIDRKGNKVAVIINESKLVKKNEESINLRDSRRFSCSDISRSLKIDTKSLSISTSGPLSDSISSSGFYGSPGKGTTKNHYNNIQNNNFIYKINGDHDITNQWSTPLLARNARLRQLQSEESILKKLSTHKDDTFLVDRFPAEIPHDASVRQFLKKNSSNYCKANAICNKNSHNISTSLLNGRNQNGENCEARNHMSKIVETSSYMHLQDQNAHSDEEKSSKQKLLQYSNNQLQYDQKYHTEEIEQLLNENLHGTQSQQKHQMNRNNEEQHRYNLNVEMEENLLNKCEEKRQQDRKYLESESEDFDEMENLWHSQLIGKVPLYIERNQVKIQE